MKVCRGVEVQLHTFLMSALDGSKWSTPRSGHLTPWKTLRYSLHRRLRGLTARPDVSGTDVSLLGTIRRQILSLINLVTCFNESRSNKLRTSVNIVTRMTSFSFAQNITSKLAPLILKSQIEFHNMCFKLQSFGTEPELTQTYLHRGCIHTVPRIS
jgi:hypothetical protein